MTRSRFSSSAIASAWLLLFSISPSGHFADPYCRISAHVKRPLKGFPTQTPSPRRPPQRRLVSLNLHPRLVGQRPAETAVRLPQEHRRAPR